MDVSRVQSHTASVAAHVECCVVVITRRAVCCTPLSAAALSLLPPAHFGPAAAPRCRGCHGAALGMSWLQCQLVCVM